MTDSKPFSSPTAPAAPERRSSAERFEQDATLAGFAADGVLRAIDVAAIVLLGLLVVPPLAILVVVVVVPLLAIGLVVGLLAAIVTVPYLLVRRVRGHHGGHRSLLAHRLRVAGEAIMDLAPHRIDAAARKLHPGR